MDIASFLKNDIFWEPTASFILTNIIDWISMKTYVSRIRLSYPDFADEAPDDFSNLPGLITLVRAGGGNPGQILKLTPLFKPWKGLGNKQSLLFENKPGSVLGPRQRDSPPLCEGLLWECQLSNLILKFGGLQNTGTAVGRISGSPGKKKLKSFNIKKTINNFFIFSMWLKNILNKEYAFVCKI